MPETPAALARLYFDRFPHDPTLAEQALAPAFRFHHLVEIEGPAAFAEFMRGVGRAFPDFRFELRHLFAAGELVAAHYDFSGTQTETFLGRVPSLGRSFIARGMSIFRCEDGLIQEIWVAFDTLSMMEQLGAVQGTAGS